MAHDGDAQSAFSELYDALDWSRADGRPAVAIGMVASVDGAATVDGGSSGLGGDADLRAFRSLREAADVVLVGAGTVRAEDYGPATAGEAARSRRVAAGRRPQAELAVVTASVDLDPESRLFGNPDLRPLLVTTQDAPEDRLAELVPERADVVRAGTGRVDHAAALAALAARGHQRVLVEGGPRLNAQLFDAGLVDEVFLTIAPTIVGEATRRIVDGELSAPVTLHLVHALPVGDELLLRYRLRER